MDAIYMVFVASCAPEGEMHVKTSACLVSLPACVYVSLVPAGNGSRPSMMALHTSG